MSGTPFSFTNSKVLLLPVVEPCVGLLCLVSSHSVPLSIASAAGEEASLAATSLSPSVDQHQGHYANYNVIPINNKEISGLLLTNTWLLLSVACWIESLFLCRCTLIHAALG